jgi:hypothetical protein
MASHGVSWAPGAHARFGNLDLITAEEGLALAPAPIQPPCSASLDAVVGALEKLQLRAPEACAPKSNPFLDFNYGRLECQLAVFLGPQPS